MTPLLQTRDLTCRFGGLTAVDAVNFEIGENQVRAVIGPNGAGKSTLVNMICGRIAPTSGKIVFQEQDITTMSAHRRVRAGIAYTFQITSIFPNLTVRENVMLAANRGAESTNRGADDRIFDVIRRVGLSKQADRGAGALAYGHQRLVEIAMGLALDPKLLILDEPTQGLSDGEIENFCDLVREIARDKTVLLIEHNMPVVMQLADRVTVMNAGRVLAEGTPSEIRDDAGVQRAYLGGGDG